MKPWVRSSVVLAMVLIAIGIVGKGVTADGEQKLFLPVVLREVSRSVGAPQLKWQMGGCYSSQWCETGWYASPAVDDVDLDGRMEIVAGSYSVVILDGETGSLEGLRMGGDSGRVWPGVVVADFVGGPQKEILFAESQKVQLYDWHGFPIWQSSLLNTQWEYRSLAVANLDGQNGLEVLVASTKSDQQWQVWRGEDGSSYPGNWPQHGPDGPVNGYAAGCYNQNVAAEDLDGDGRGEIVGPSDVHYITAYEDDGTQLRTHLRYGTNPDGSLKYWSRVGVHVDDAVDVRGYADCGVEHRPNFAHSAPVLADLDGNGQREIVVIGDVYNCDTYQSLYQIPFIFNRDRTRWASSGFSWVTLPAAQADMAPLSQDWQVIEMSMPDPVVADLDGDGYAEILYAGYDGKLHAFWLDKTEHGSWPYAVYDPGQIFYRFASAPVVADLENDGSAEVIFTSWTQKNSGQTGKLHILRANGSVLFEVDLPGHYSTTQFWDGALASPTLANVDMDADLEVVIQSAHSGVLVYDLPNTASARILWGTGRANFLRSGAP